MASIGTGEDAFVALGRRSRKFVNPDFTLSGQVLVGKVVPGDPFTDGERKFSEAVATSTVTFAKTVISVRACIGSGTGETTGSRMPYSPLTFLACFARK